MKQLTNAAKFNGYVRSKAGRLRRLPEIQRIVSKWGDCIFNSLELWKEYNEDPFQYNLAKQDARILNNLLNNALNFPIQSYAASIVNKASIEIMKKFAELSMKSYICLQIHDEICIMAPDSELQQVCQIMKHYMENTTKLAVPLKAEPIIGTCYGDVK